MLINFRLLVPLEHAGRVIGRSGEVIKQIRQQTSARVKMHEPTDGEAEQGCAGGSSSRLGSGLMHATTCTIALMVRHKGVCSGEQSRSLSSSTPLLYYFILLDTIFSICHLDACDAAADCEPPGCSMVQADDRWQPSSALWQSKGLA